MVCLAEGQTTLSVADIISISTYQLCSHRTAAEGLEYATTASS